jgi:hypothetical protein
MDVVAPTRLVIIEGTAGDDGESGGLRREVALMRDRSESVPEAEREHDLGRAREQGTDRWDRRAH